MADCRLSLGCCIGVCCTASLAASESPFFATQVSKHCRNSFSKRMAWQGLANQSLGEDITDQTHLAESLFFVSALFGAVELFKSSQMRQTVAVSVEEGIPTVRTFRDGNSVDQRSSFRLGLGLVASGVLHSLAASARVPILCHPGLKAL